MNLRSEQEATLARPRLRYGLTARALFLVMDLMYGKKVTVPKIRFLELLARIPYQAWELRQYRRLNRGFADDTTRREAEQIIAWGRAAQDNEYWHLVIAAAKMREDHIAPNPVWQYVVRPIAACKYAMFAAALTRMNIRLAWWFNAQFEDHAEHAYMQFVKDNPQLDEQPVETPVVHDGRGPEEEGRYASWGDVFRRCALDERAHMNASLKWCGKPELIVGSRAEQG